MKPSTGGAVAAWVGAISAFATTAVIALFDLGAALDIGGFEVGRFPLFMAWAIAPAYLALVASLHAQGTDGERLWTSLSLTFAIVYAAVVSVNYPLQIVSVHADPAVFGAWTIDLRPDSAFWALEVAGYMFMGLSALCLVPALGGSALRRWAGWLFIVNAVGTAIGAAAYFITGDPGHVLAMGSLLVWGLAFPAATFLLGCEGLVRARRGQGQPAASLN